MGILQQCSGMECKVSGKEIPPALLMAQNNRIELLKQFVSSQPQTCGLSNMCGDETLREAIFAHLLTAEKFADAAELLTSVCFFGVR